MVSNEAAEAADAPGAAQLRRQLRLVERAPGFIAILTGPDHVFDFVNDSYVKMVGPRSFLGRPVRQVLPEIEGQGFFERLDAVYATGKRHGGHDMTIRLRRGADGLPQERVLDFVFEPIVDDAGRVEGIFVEGYDVTEARRAQEGLEASQRRQALLVRLADRLRDRTDPADISYAAAELLGDALGVSRAGYGTIDLERETITIERDWNAPGITSLAGTLHFRDYGSYIEDLRRGETVVFADAETDPRTAATAGALKAISAQAVVNMPITEQGGFVALLYLNHAAAREWTPDELALVREVADRTRMAVERARAEQSLELSVRRLRLASAAARMAVWEYHTASETLVGSPELNRLLGYAGDAVLDIEVLAQRYYPGDDTLVRSAGLSALASGERFFEVPYRFYRADGALRWFLLRAEIILDAAGAPARTIGVLLDITDQKIAEEALIERDAELKAALDAGALAIFDFDHDSGLMKPSPRLSELYGYPPDHVLSIADIRARYHPEDMEDIFDRIGREQDDPAVTQFRWILRLRLDDGAIRWLEGRGEHVRGPSGRIQRSRGVVLDVTERRRWEEHQRLLVNELNHRVKNTLAVVQGLAQQSFRPGEEPQVARRTFEARLAALAAAHNLLTRQSWESASIGQIVHSAVSAAAGARTSSLDVGGPEITVPPQTAVSIVLAIHELCTNAVKYGALSTPEGGISIRWTVHGEPDAARFRLEWTERGGPVVSPPARRGFGSRLIERGLSSELHGSAVLHFEPGGLRCVIDAPVPHEEAFAHAAV